MKIDDEIDADKKALEIYLKLGYSEKYANEAYAKIFGNMNEKRNTMKGMKSAEFVEMVNFIQKYHKFALYMTDEEKKERNKLYPTMAEYGFNIKYIDSCYDSRFADIWSVSFRGLGAPDLCFHTNTNIVLPQYPTLFEWIMAFLKSEWKPTSSEWKSIRKDEN